MKRILSLIAVGALLASVSAFAQAPPYLQGQQLRLVNSGQQFGGILIAPNPVGADDVFTLPPGGGQLVTTATAGWIIGGQAVLPANPGILGSLDAANVSLVANNTTRMTLLEADPAVLLPLETELRLGDGGSQYSALVSPPAITPDGTNPGNITYVLPDEAPAGEDVRMKVKSITANGNNRVVEFDYTNPNTTGQIGFKGLSAPTCNMSNVNYVPVTGMTFEVVSDAIYSFEAIVEIDPLKDNGEITWGTATTDTQDGAVSILYRLFELTGNGNLPGGLDEDSEQPVTAGDTYILKGYIQTGTLVAPEPYTVQLRVKRGNSGSEVCITAKSAVQLISE